MSVDVSHTSFTGDDGTCFLSNSGKIPFEPVCIVPTISVRTGSRQSQKNTRWTQCQRIFAQLKSSKVLHEEKSQLQKFQRLCNGRSLKLKSRTQWWNNVIFNNLFVATSTKIQFDFQKKKTFKAESSAANSAQNTDLGTNCWERNQIMLETTMRRKTMSKPVTRRRTSASHHIQHSLFH
jgi:hypothetical protein